MKKECPKDLPIEKVWEVINSFQSDVTIKDTGTSYIIKPWKDADQDITDS